MVALGFTLQPDEEFLGLCDEIIASRIDYVEIVPETSWQVDESGRLYENDFHAHFAALMKRAGLFAVAHGVGLSLGTAHDEGPRRARWIERMRADQRVFDYRWYTEHLGASSLAGQFMVLPVPTPMTALTAALIGQRLDEMRAVVGDVGVENSAFYMTWGPPSDEPQFLNRLLAEPGRHLLLDLHNLYTAAVNFGVDARAYLDALELERVIEIHLSGGSASAPTWLPGGDVMRLDSHDSAIPEPVWALLTATLPRCPNLRGVTIERMEGTVEAADVAVIASEVERARALIEQFAGAEARPGPTPARTSPVSPASPASPTSTDNIDGYVRFEHGVAEALRGPDPAAAIRALASDESIPAQLRRAAAAVEARGVQITALLIAQLRFNRLLQGSPAAALWFEREPAEFARAFRAYHAEVVPSAYFPAEEGQRFLDWQLASELS
ncbi:MAG: hypothetical protein Tsb0020_11010 [Haliangiales bacterium]